MALINIRFAPNAFMVYAIFMNIVTFNLIPTNNIDNALFNVNQQLSNQAFTPAFNDLDIF